MLFICFFALRRANFIRYRRQSKSVARYAVHLPYVSARKRLRIRLDAASVEILPSHIRYACTDPTLQYIPHATKKQSVARLLA